MGKMARSRQKITIDIISFDEKEEFVLDVGRSYIKLSKLVLQTRARVAIVLARLDIDGAPHRNPDDTEIPCPHLHLYREGYNHKWAFEVPAVHFQNLRDRRQIVADFMQFCRIVDPPEFREDLLS